MGSILWYLSYAEYYVGDTTLQNDNKDEKVAALRKRSSRIRYSFILIYDLKLLKYNQMDKNAVIFKLFQVFLAVNEFENENENGSLPKKKCFGINCQGKYLFYLHFFKQACMGNGIFSMGRRFA